MDMALRTSGAHWRQVPPWNPASLESCLPQIKKILLLRSLPVMLKISTGFKSMSFNFRQPTVWTRRSDFPNVIVSPRGAEGGAQQQGENAFSQNSRLKWPRP